ncbi:MAG TPA: CBS domain-containing protein [Solirubrobacter sp.]|nr:CBS domain-containing protein [Solirubrobacter sp.]
MTRTLTHDVLAHTTVREAMQLGLFECDAATDLPTLGQMMAEKAIHGVVVAGVERRDHNGKPLEWGIVSDLDLMRGLESGRDAVTAGDLAAPELLVVKPDDTLEHAVRLMVEHEATHVIVASPDTGLPAGMLSTLDIARAVSRNRAG